MEMASAHQPLLTAAHLQALGTDPMLYRSRVSAWQPVVASLPPVTEIPKESIIVNTDFTTTSLIAKRRLSSKRRRKQYLEGTSKDGVSESPRRSPVICSTASPSNTSTTCTPPSVERRMDEGLPHEDSSSAVVASSQHSSVSSGGAPVVMVPASVVGAPSRAGSARISTSMGVPDLHEGDAIPSRQHSSNAGFQQYPHKVDILYLQDQALLQQPQAIVPQASSSGTVHSQPVCSTSQPTSQGTLNIRGQNGFKWCTAHVTIAKQIQLHKQKKNETPFSHTKSPPSCSSQQTVSSHAPNVATLPTQSQQHLFPPPPQQHISTTATSTPHLTLMQYNLPPNNVMAANAAPTAAPAAVAAAASAYPPGYLAVPYSSVQELQMRMQPSLVPIPAAQLQLGSGGGIQVMKPVMAISDNNVVGLNLGLQMIGGVNGGLHPSLQQQQPHLASLAAPGHHHLTHASSAGVLPGPGSWGVAPIQSVNNCVFNHNFQPGIMATPWVK